MLITIAIVIAGIFFVLKCFDLPQSFYNNQAKREKMIKDNIKKADNLKEVLYIDSSTGKNNSTSSNTV